MKKNILMTIHRFIWVVRNLFVAARAVRKTLNYLDPKRRQFKRFTSDNPDIIF